MGKIRKPWETDFENRVILHCDLNSFFASAELLEHPELKRKCVAVGGDEKSRHGIILAKNDYAKRRGVQTGEPLGAALKKCPELVLLPAHFEKYLQYSEAVRSIYLRYTDLVESFGADECWLDVTGSTFIFGSGVKIANEIRETVKRETGLTISAGVSFNKIFAKLGSDMKKPDATTEISRENFREKIWSLNCGDLFGVGRSTVAKLKCYGIKTIGDLAGATEGFMKENFGKCGVTILKYARGDDDSPVSHRDYSPIVKSIGHGCTSAFDLCDFDAAKLLTETLAEGIAEKLHAAGLAAHSVTIYVKNMKSEGASYSEAYREPIKSAKQIYSLASEILKKNYPFTEPIRAISISVGDLQAAENPFQIDFFTDFGCIEKAAAIDKITEKIRFEMGEKAIFRAGLMNVGFARANAIYEFNPFKNNFMR